MFWRGFTLIVGAAAIFNTLSIYHAWVSPYGFVADGGVPFPLIQHGDFDTQTFVDWVGALDNVVSIGLVAALGGLVSMRLFRAARMQAN
ncbi:MAG TPA: hypothetical protein VGF24_32150 [Vicinamibacterales bacterium]